VLLPPFGHSCHIIDLLFFLSVQKAAVVRAGMRMVQPAPAKVVSKPSTQSRLQKTLSNRKAAQEITVRAERSIESHFPTLKRQREEIDNSSALNVALVGTSEAGIAESEDGDEDNYEEEAEAVEEDDDDDDDEFDDMPPLRKMAKLTSEVPFEVQELA
jgi:hypothetical protein